MNQYQRIYNNVPWYGSARHGRCPSFKLYPYYEKWLRWWVLDYGCGRGDTVTHMRKRGKRAYGYDVIQNDSKYCFSELSKIKLKVKEERTTFLCIDVLEHLTEENIRVILDYAVRFNNQIISVNNKTSPSPITGEELHLTLKPFDWWVYELSHYFEIAQVIDIHRHQKLFFCKTRKDIVPW